MHQFKFFFVCLFSVLGIEAQAISSRVGFSPQLTASCSVYSSEYVTQLNFSSCGSTLSAVLSSQAEFSSCSSGVDGTDCFQLGDIEAANDFGAADIILPYQVRNQSACSMCTPHDGILPGCVALMEAVVAAAYGAPVDYGSFGYTDPTMVTQLQASALNVTASCGADATSVASLQILNYQAQVLCASSDDFNMTLDSQGTIDGVLDLRNMLQCGTCAVIPCLSGQLCDGVNEAHVCPHRYYCPTPVQRLDCPQGYYCPEGTTDPIKCRGIAAGSCGKNSWREVVWVPLFLVLLFTLLIVLAQSYRSAVMGNVLQKAQAACAQFKRIPKHAGKHFDDAVRSIPVAIRFQHLRLVTNGYVRVTDVSGVLKPARFTAILGGSGAGKTSLMNIVLGREQRTSGELDFLALEDGVPSPEEMTVQALADAESSSRGRRARKLSAALLDRIVAFVPQNDVFLRDMTVQELVQHSARTRLPVSLSRGEVSAKVDSVLEQLQLASIRHATAGSALSPGDRKLVNIALELVSDPAVLFLDEPTTGIDSSSAMNVARIVSNLARSGLTCVAVIHQPRGEIFSLMDEMIILSRGGRVAFDGPTSAVLPYFESLGFPLQNPKANKTDFIIDLTSKIPERGEISTGKATVADAERGDLQQGSRSSSFIPDSGELVQELEDASKFWPRMWDEKGVGFITAWAKHNPSRGIADGARGSYETEAASQVLALENARPGFFRQLYLYAFRGGLQHFKAGILLTDFGLFIAGGVLMGIKSSGGPLLIDAIPFIYQGSCPPGAERLCNQWIRFETGPSAFLMMMVLGVVVIPGAVRTFGREKEVFSREAAVGANRLSYFLGKSLSDLPFLAVHVFLFMAPVVAIAPWRAPTDDFYGALFMTAWVVHSMAYFLSFVFQDPDAAVLVGTILAILLCLFSGFVPLLGDGPIGQIMYTHWGARAIVTAELQSGQEISETDDYNSIVPDEWQDPDYTADCVNMLIITIVLQLVSFLLLSYKNRRISS